MAKGKYEYWLTEEGQRQLREWSIKGLSDIQIAKNIGISKDTFYKWKQKYTDFADCLRQSKQIADIEVENALFKSACGYWTEETTVEKVYSIEFGKMIPYKEKTIKKFVPANAIAQKFWLINRASEEWKDKREETIDTTDNTISVKFAADIADYAN